MSRTLWLPAAATSSARLAVVWPRTSLKSRHSSGWGASVDALRTCRSKAAGYRRNLTASAR